MRRLLALFFSIFIMTGGMMAQQMSDEQVVQYVKEAQRSGKSQKQMTTELLRRGVTKRTSCPYPKEICRAKHRCRRSRKQTFATS